MRPKTPSIEEYVRDPIRAAQLREEYDNYVERLFEPIEPFFLDSPMPYVVEGFIPKGYLVIIASAPKQGKTCLATSLALAVATGTPFAGLQTVQSSVIWLSMEESRRERWLLLKQSPLADPATPLYTCYEYLPIDQEDSLEVIESWVARTGAKLVVVDSLHAASSGRSLQDGWNARKTLQRLRTFCNTFNVTVLVLHHAKDVMRSRAPRVAESDQIAATASMSIVLTQLQGSKGKDPYRIVTLHCSGRGDFANRKVSLLSHAPLDYQVIQEVEVKPKKVDLRHDEQQVVDFLRGKPKSAAQIEAQFGYNDQQLRNVLTRLRQKGLITLVRSSKQPRKYRLCGDLQKKKPVNPGSNEPA